MADVLKSAVRSVRSRPVKAKWTPNLGFDRGENGRVSLAGGTVVTPHGIVAAFAKDDRIECEVVIGGRLFRLTVDDERGGLVGKLTRTAGEFAAECAERHAQLTLRGGSRAL